MIFPLDTDILIDLLRHYPPSGTPYSLFTDEALAMPTSGGGQLIRVFRYDITSDGQRVVIAKPLQGETPMVTVVLNWIIE
ncbi:MAG TPA: hypothetical protein DIT99_21810 [Candidatus Latescibacteria bacterium]|nr:hypothetical protein [Candidatus Latescibacterota bacterium]